MKKFPISDIDIENWLWKSDFGKVNALFRSVQSWLHSEMVLSNSVDTVKYLLWVEMLQRKLFSRLVNK